MSKNVKIAFNFLLDFSPYDYVNIMDHIGKLMELTANILMAVVVEACRLVDTVQKRRIVDQYLKVYSIPGQSSRN